MSSCLSCLLMVVTCAPMDIRISSHGPLKTSSHLAVHIHVSPILTRLCCETTPEVVPILPLSGPPQRHFGRCTDWPPNKMRPSRHRGASSAQRLQDARTARNISRWTTDKQTKHTLRDPRPKGNRTHYTSTDTRTPPPPPLSRGTPACPALPRATSLSCFQTAALSSPLLSLSPLQGGPRTGLPGEASDTVWRPTPQAGPAARSGPWFDDQSYRICPVCSRHPTSNNPGQRIQRALPAPRYTRLRRRPLRWLPCEHPHFKSGPGALLEKSVDRNRRILARREEASLRGLR